MHRSIVILALILSATFAAPTRADIISFAATGSAGLGLLEGNIDPATGEPGTGGIGSTGITYNTDTNILHVHVEWGSGNGYVDLSDDVMMLHLHGPTADAGAAGFGQTAPLVVNLSNSNSFVASASDGEVNDNFFLDEADEQGLLEGRYYINVHLSSADTGVIRGYLIAVPEPGMAIPSLLCLVAFVSRRKRQAYRILSPRCTTLEIP